MRAPTTAATGAYTAASSASSSAPRPSNSIRRSLGRRDGCRGVLRRALRAERVGAGAEVLALHLAVDQDRAAVAEGRGHRAVVDDREPVGGRRVVRVGG